MGKYEFVAVPHNEVHIVWPHVAQMLKAAADTASGRASPGRIMEECSAGMMTLWVVLDAEKNVKAALCTKEIQYPSRKALAVPWVGGEDMKNWLAMVMDTLDRVAESTGCDLIEGYGREGWLRHLEKFGWRKAYAVFEKDI